MINTISHARSYARNLKRMLKQYGVTHLQAHDIAARTIGARDWRTLAGSNSMSASRDDINIKLQDELSKIPSADIQAILTTLLPPEGEKAQRQLFYDAIENCYSPAEFIMQSIPGHKENAPSEEASLASEWENVFETYDLNEPIPLSDMRWQLNDEFPLNEFPNPISDDYHQRFGRWPREDTIYKIFDHIIDEEPLPARLARDKDFVQSCIEHREAIRSLIPEEHISKPYGFMSIDLIPVPDGAPDQRIVAWSWLYVDDVEGSMASMPFVGVRTILTQANVGDNLGNAMESNVIAFAGVTGAGMMATEIYDEREPNEHPRLDDRIFRYWFEAKDEQLSDAQNALHYDFAPSQGHHTVEEWSSRQREKKLGGDIYVVEYLEVGHHKLSAIAIKAATDALAKGLRGILPMTRNLRELTKSLNIGATGLTDANGQPVPVMADEEIEKLTKYEWIVRCNSPEERDMRYPVLDAPGVVISDDRITGGQLSTMLPGQLVHEYNSRKLNRSNQPRPPRNDPNPFTQPIDDLDDELDEMQESTRMGQEMMEAEEIIQDALGYEKIVEPVKTFTAFAVQLGVAARGIISPEHLLDTGSGGSIARLATPDRVKRAMQLAKERDEARDSNEYKTRCMAHASDNVVLDRREWHGKTTRPGARAAELAEAILARLAKYSKEYAEEAAAEMYAAAIPSCIAGRNENEERRNKIILEARIARRSAR